MQQDYVFTDLEGRESLVQEIRKLEEKIEQSIGEKVNLIAYSEKKDHPQH
ncbi:MULTISPECIES: hypothetical protein [Paenibacillus]|uniref:Uncharacterized protein n=1 Tax=Paenibacillus barengoltzii G22 TaxID=1235795 RepID=R9L7L2_9BACL|nr:MULTISPECIES: hypothetical protein [Paenibacillus]EOS54675.1 hypothetical protein C812_03450 [Paenibacillus barengoltzii G22]MDU0331185.1 hypothetical protein [Paenibacillus sp. 3LSP]